MSRNEKNKKWLIVTAAVILCFAFAGAARAGTGWMEEQKFLASDGAIGDIFGCSVSISGDYAIVGTPGDNDNGNTSGSAYIFNRNGTSWNQQAKLTASDGAANDYFGYCVSISGGYAIVGAIYNDEKGSVYAFRFCPRADLDDNCQVDLADFAIFADWRLYGTN